MKPAYDSKAYSSCRLLSCATLLGWAMLVISGCGPRSATPDPESSPVASPQTTATRRPNIPDRVSSPLPAAASLATAEIDAVSGLDNRRFVRPLEAELARVDAKKDGWDSEAFSDQAAAQLRLLMSYLQAPPSNDTVLDGVCLRDATMVTVSAETVPVIYSDQQTAVRRWQLTNQTTPSSAMTSVPILVGLQALRQTARWEFKIIDVGFDANHPRTEILVERLASDAERSTQTNWQWACDWQSMPDGPPQLRSMKLQEYAETSLSTAGQRFLDSTAQVLAAEPSWPTQLLPSLDYWRQRLDWRFGSEIVGAHGLAIGDANGDGLDDVYICEPGGLPNRLLIQQPEGTARDIAAAAHVDFLEPTHSALFVDLDNDGDQDLVLTSGRYLLTLTNEGGGIFGPPQVRAFPSVLRSIAAADYDNNGFVDLYLCGYFARESNGDGVGLGRPLPYHDANNGAPNFLLSNRGPGNLTDVTKEVGLDENNNRFSYACAWADYDQDGDQDLYVANDFGRNNLYRNDAGTFHDVAAIAGVEDISAGMSACWADFNRDGFLDVYVGNMYSSAGNRVAYQRQYLPSATDAERQLYQRHARGNSLFANEGNGTFRDVSLFAGVNMARWAWSSNFVDLNNDGWDDIVVANGMITSETDPGDL